VITTKIAGSMAERLAHEQAALCRVATLGARGAETSEVFAAVAREVAEVMHPPIAAVQRYENDETTTVIAAWSDRPHPPTHCSTPIPPGRRWEDGLCGSIDGRPLDVR
jgi:hypothetical protein